MEALSSDTTEVRPFLATQQELAKAPKESGGKQQVLNTIFVEWYVSNSRQFAGLPSGKSCCHWRWSAGQLPIPHPGQEIASLPTPPGTVTVAVLNRDFRLKILGKKIWRKKQNRSTSSQRWPQWGVSMGLHRLRAVRSYLPCWCLEVGRCWQGHWGMARWSTGWVSALVRLRRRKPTGTSLWPCRTVVMRLTRPPWKARSSRSPTWSSAVPARAVARRLMWSWWLSSLENVWSLPMPLAALPFGVAPTHPSHTPWMPRVKACLHLAAGFNLKETSIIFKTSKAVSWCKIIGVSKGVEGQVVVSCTLSWSSARPSWAGPAWANSLFEDNAEFGFGMRKAKDRQDSRIPHCSGFRFPYIWHLYCCIADYCCISYSFVWCCPICLVWCRLSSSDVTIWPTKLRPGSEVFVL